MATTKYVVFVLPVIFSIVFGSAAMAYVLEESDRDLNMWRFGESGGSHDESIQIIGLAKQYSVSSPVKIMVNVDDKFFDCGDLYITIFSAGDSISAQSGFLEQCFVQTNAQLPLGNIFSEVIDAPGEYKIVAEMRDKEQKFVISATEKFTVK